VVNSVKKWNILTQLRQMKILVNLSRSEEKLKDTQFNFNRLILKTTYHEMLRITPISYVEILITIRQRLFTSFITMK